MALVEMHDHLSRQFPEVCPMDRPGDRPLRGVAAGEPPGAGRRGHRQERSRRSRPQPLAPVAASLKATAEDLGTFADAEVYKGFKKMRKKLGKKVLAGKMTVDEARARIGPPVRPEGRRTAGGREVGQTSATGPPTRSSRRGTPITETSSAAVLQPLKSAVADALRVESVPLEAATIEACRPVASHQGRRRPRRSPRSWRRSRRRTTKLAETQRVIDAIADQPDPSTAAFSGLAFNPVRTRQHARRASPHKLRSRSEPRTWSSGTCKTCTTPARTPSSGRGTTRPSPR